MYNFILQILIMSSLGAMIYMIARAVPRIGDLEDFSKNHSSRLDRIIGKIPLEKIDIAASFFLEKILRKIKLFLMKLDNSLTGHLKKIKKSNGNGGEDKPTLFGE